MKLHFVFSIILYFNPIFASSSTVRESFSDVRLLIRDAGWDVRVPDEFRPRPINGPGLGQNGWPRQGAQGQDGLTWVHFLLQNRPRYQLSSREDMVQALNSESPIRVGIAYDRETGAVEPILRGLTDTSWSPGPGRRVYEYGVNDASETQRLLVVSADVELDPMNILEISIEANPAINRILQYYGSPYLDPSQVREMMEDAFMAAVPDIESVSQTTAYFLAARMGQVARLLRLQEAGETPQDGAFLRSRKRSPIGIQENERRATSIDTIESQESTASSGSNNSTADYASEFQNYLSAFYIIQAEISNLLFPVLNELITSSNSSLVHQIAWSIWSDLTVSTQRVVGPFMYGLSSLTSIEDEYFNSTHRAINANGTMVMNRNDSAGIVFLAVFGALEKLYYTTWEKAINATNSTGLLADLDMLVTYLTPADTSICPPGFLNASNSNNNAKGAYSVMVPPMNISSHNFTSNIRL